MRRQQNVSPGAHQRALAPGRALRREIERVARETGRVTGLPRLSPAVLDAIQRVPRQRFVASTDAAAAWQDVALAIGQGQTISQPFVVALMTELLQPEPGDRILEIGTGSGYQAAVLAELVQAVFSIERIRSLADAATARLSALGYRNITVRSGDGQAGWPTEAPFDGILVTAAGNDVPHALLEQLRPGAFLVMPVRLADGRQMLRRITRRADGSLQSTDILPVAFVPLV
jgi:protein-L-isoaspartate(D-aspartate) O-methyltransferase